MKKKNKNKSVRVNKGGKREEWRAVDEEIQFFLSYPELRRLMHVCPCMHICMHVCVCVQICHMKINQLKRGRRSARGKKEEGRR